MTKLEIDTERGFEDLETQIMEMETHQLLDIYDFFETNPSVYSQVANELMFRREHETKLKHEGQVSEIEQRLW